ncbi:hypothetical protein E3Q24_00662 [Wallemia mellicola]|nr:hypothetical protein E3Q24_00662 [Wallemia mellicola]
MSEGGIRRRASYSSNIKSFLPSEIASHLPSATSSALDYLDLHGTVDAVWSAGERLQRCFFDVENRVKIFVESNPTSISKDLLKMLTDLRTMDIEKLRLPSVQSQIEYITVKLKSVMASSPDQVVLDKWDEIRRLVEEEFQDKAQLFDSVVEHSFDSAKKSIERALIRAQNGAKLIKFNELPDAWKNNEHILTGYRFIPIDNKRDLFLSAFKWHNETINVQTHLWAAVGVTMLLLYHVVAPHPVWIAEDTMVSYHGLDNTLTFLAPIIPSLLFYVVGLIIYAFQIPECFAPGRFDFAFASHNAWHIAVAAAIFLHYKAIVTHDIAGSSLNSSMSNLFKQDEFAKKLEPPEEARQLGPPSGPSILKNSSEKQYKPSHERSSDYNQKESPRKLSVDSISFAPLPQRPTTMPRRNSITLGVAARSSFFNNAGGATNVHKNPDGSMVKTFTPEQWKQLEESQGRNVVDLGNVAVVAGKKFVNLLRGRRDSKDKTSDKEKEQFRNPRRDEKKLEDVGEVIQEEDAEIENSDDTLSPNTSQSHISQTTSDASDILTPPSDAMHMRTSSGGQLQPYKQDAYQEDEHLKAYALGFDPAKLGARRQQMKQIASTSESHSTTEFECCETTREVLEDVSQ